MCPAQNSLHSHAVYLLMVYCRPWHPLTSLTSLDIPWHPLLNGTVLSNPSDQKHHLRQLHLKSWNVKLRGADQVQVLDEQAILTWMRWCLCCVCFNHPDELTWYPWISICSIQLGVWYGQWPNSKWLHFFADFNVVAIILADRESSTLRALQDIQIDHTWRLEMRLVTVRDRWTQTNFTNSWLVQHVAFFERPCLDNLNKAWVCMNDDRRREEDAAEAKAEEEVLCSIASSESTDHQRNCWKHTWVRPQLIFPRTHPKKVIVGKESANNPQLLDNIRQRQSVENYNVKGHLL